jgi:hypothetical protein
MPRRHRRNYVGGAMPLSYLDKSYTEPSASAGVDRNISEVGLARPVLNHTGGSRKKRTRHTRKRVRKMTYKHRKVGGFVPSVMGGFIQNAKMLIPAAGINGYRMWKNYNKTKKNRY